MPAAITSLEAAAKRLAMITPELCLHFLHAWRQDLAHWKQMCPKANSVSGYPEALRRLGAKSWAAVPTLTSGELPAGRPGWLRAMKRRGGYRHAPAGAGSSAARLAPAVRLSQGKA